MTSPSENQEGNNPIAGSNNDPQRAPDNPFHDTFQTTKTQPSSKPGFLGKITRAAVATLAIGTAGAVARAQTSEDGLKTLNSDAHRMIDAVKDTSDTLADKISEPKQETQIPIVSTSSSPEPQGAVGEEAASADPNLTELNKIFDTFVEDLKQHPAHKMFDMGETGIEGYKITIKDTTENVDKTIKFMRQKSESHPTLDEITVEIATDEKKSIYTILGNDISLRETYADPNKPNESAPPHRSIADMLTTELNKLYQQWAKQRVKGGEVVTSADQAIPQENQQYIEPSPTNTPEPTATNTSSPTPKATQPPYIPDLGPLDGGIEEASAKPSAEQPPAPNPSSPKANLS